MNFEKTEIHVGPGVSDREVYMLQLVLALHRYAQNHEEDASAIDFAHPRQNERRVQNAAMMEWIGDQGPDTLRGRFRAFLDTLNRTGQDYGDVDFTDATACGRLLQRIESEQGPDSATQHIQ